jgi:alcohol dehydrogenase class IV
MKSFDYFQPTEIKFGFGRLKEVGEIVVKYGKNCLLVTVEPFPALEPVFEETKKYLEDAGVKVIHFTGVIPNPTTDSITDGADIAKDKNIDVVLGLGGGSSMDTAKAIAIEVTHPRTSWDYLWDSQTQPQADKTLPIIAVTTTSGTGSHVTPVSVLTNPKEKYKSAIVNPVINPVVGIVDPELMMSVPEHITASTGFDVFTHTFEAYQTPACSPYIAMIAKEAIRNVIKYLPVIVKDGSNREGREALAWADTLGGLCIANAGVTLPHGMGMAIGGIYPKVAHGEALAVVYPEITRFTYASGIEQYSTLGRIINPALESESDEAAAEKSCQELDNFLKDIGMYFGLSDFEIPEDELDALADQCMVLPDYKNNPKVPDLKDVRQILQDAYNRS